MVAKSEIEDYVASVNKQRQLERKAEQAEAEATAHGRIVEARHDYLKVVDPKALAAAERQLTGDAEDGGGEAPKPTPNGDGPRRVIIRRKKRSLRGREAVQAVLTEAGKPMTATEIAEVIRERGWVQKGADVLDSTRAAIARAVKAYPEIQRVGHGLYAHVPQNDSGPTPEGGEATAQPPG